MEWHYALKGERLGPTSQDQMIAMIRENVLSPETVVWNREMPTWAPIATTPLAAHFPSDQPPPLVGDAVDNTVIWVLAFAPVIGLFLEGFFGSLLGIATDSLWFITVVLNIILATADESKLKKAGHDTSKMGAAWLVPVYLYKRAGILKQTYAYFTVWCVLFGLLLLGVL